MDTQHRNEKKSHDLENRRSVIDYSIVFENPAIRVIVMTGKIVEQQKLVLRHKSDQLQNFRDPQDAEDLHNSNDSGITVCRDCSTPIRYANLQV